jgi:IS1 family transposase
MALQGTPLLPVLGNFSSSALTTVYQPKVSVLRVSKHVVVDDLPVYVDYRQGSAEHGQAGHWNGKWLVDNNVFIASANYCSVKRRFRRWLRELPLQWELFEVSVNPVFYVVSGSLAAIGNMELRFNLPIHIESEHSLSDGQVGPKLLFAHLAGGFGNFFGSPSGGSGLLGLFSDSQKRQDNGPCCRPSWPSEKSVPTWGVPFGIAYVFLGMLGIRFGNDSVTIKVCAILCGLLGGAFVLTGYEECQPKNHHEHEHILPHDGKIVTQKLLTSSNYRNTLITMANVLSTEKQIAGISALAEGSSIRSIERMTGVHRDTIMRLGVRVGRGCAALMDAKMRDLPCARLEMDEIWGFVGKKDRNICLNEPRPVGNVWTFCAIDADTKLVPAFKVGDRDIATAKAFVADVASRMRNRVQISTDGLRAYVEAVESAFGADVDFAQIVKTYGHEEVSDNRRYSAPEFVSSEKRVITGNPNQRLISTSYVERLNATTRLHMRRLTRLTLAFSKKRENFEAAVGLHFAYYNFVKRHNTLRCTPAMAAGIERDFWSVGQLLEAVA